MKSTSLAERECWKLVALVGIFMVKIKEEINYFPAVQVSLKWTSRPYYPPPVDSVYGRIIFLPDGCHPAANNPLHPPDSSMCHFLRHLSQPRGPSPIYYECMFEGGPPDPKGMSFHWYS